VALLGPLSSSALAARVTARIAACTSRPPAKVPSCPAAAHGPAPRRGAPDGIRLNL